MAVKGKRTSVDNLVRHFLEPGLLRYQLENATSAKGKNETQLKLYQAKHRERNVKTKAGT